MTDDHPVDGLPTPSPEDDPGEVVARQLEALASNDAPFENAGILTAYNFASPGNRRTTGPRDRFVRMVRGPRYSPMVDHVEAVRGPVERDGDRATQRVTLTGPRGRTVTFRFGLSVQSTGPFAGCWMTDSVVVD
ncbi:MAG: DUF4864 domain-containing protein [Halolamina sp.]